MRKRIYSLLSAVLAIFLFASAPVIFTFADDAAEGYYNQETGYCYFVDDQAGLLTEKEKEALLDELFPLTQYGNAGVVTIDYDPQRDSEDYADDYLDYRFGSNVSSTILLIDMDTRNLTVWSLGDNLKKIGRSKGSVITDNIYRYASNEDYYGCCSEGISEIFAVLEGARIAQPMKYLSNAALAILIGLFLNYLLAKFFARNPKAADRELLNSMYAQFRFANPNTVHTNTTREYSPPSSSSGGGGGRSGGGGGHSGGGGSHRF